MRKGMCVIAILLVSFVYVGNAATWYSGNEWILKDGTSASDRFFCIGIALPIGECDDDSEINSDLADFNVLNVRSSDANGYMSSKVLLTGGSWLSWKLNGDTWPYGGYLGELDHLGYTNTDAYISYSEMQNLSSIYWQDDFKNFLYDKVVTEIADDMDGAGIDDFIFYLKDEPEINRGSWYFTPQVLGSYLGRVREYSDNELGGENRIGAIGYGPVAGNRYFYQREIGAYPDTTPYDAYREAYCSYDGSAPNYSNYYQNVSQTVNYYKDATNLHLLNSYWFFASHPKYAAKTVDAMRDGIPYSSKPIWLWFNALDMDNASSYANVRCQIYTAMTRKCTGAMLYCLESPTSTNITYARAVAAELDEFYDVWTSGVASNGYCEGYEYGTMQQVNDVMYWAIFDYSGVDYCLITNTHDSPAYIMNADVTGFDLRSTYTLIPAHGVALFRVDGYDWVMKPTGESGPGLVNLLAGIGNTDEIENDNPVVVEDGAPEEFEVSVSPNPFKPSTTLTYVLPQDGNVRIEVYSISGQNVATLVDDYRTAGNHSVVFDGAELASGLYLYRVEAAGVLKTGRMTLIK